MAIRGAKQILLLKKKRAREAEGKFLVEGIRLCEELLASPASVEQVLFAREALEADRLRLLLEGFRKRSTTIQETDRRALQAFCEAITPQGVVAVVNRGQWDQERALEGEGSVVVLDRVHDPGNLGMILRTAEAAGASAAFLTGGSVELHNPKAVRSSMGAIFRLPAFERSGILDTLSLLKAKGFRILAADARGGGREIPPGTRFALVLGSEASGMDDRARPLIDATVSIPMKGGVESLNVAVAAGILLFRIQDAGRSGHPGLPVGPGGRPTFVR